MCHPPKQSNSMAARFSSRAIFTLANNYDGHVLLEKAPDEFKKHNDVFGLPNAAWHIMHKIKARLDPDNIFSPGRLPGKV